MLHNIIPVFLILSQVSVAFSNLFNTSYFEFFYGEDFDDLKTIYPLYDPSKLLDDEHYNHSLPTMMFLDGYKEYLDPLDDFGRRTMVDAFLTRGDYNVIHVNWDQIATGSYVFDAFPNSRKFGDVLADAILKMTEDGLDFYNLHIIGHSLGGQLAGFVGRAIIKKTEGVRKLRRITSLDPAFPLFYPGWIAGHISEDDADFVDVMHTDGIIYGTPFQTGTVDFYPNGGGIFQPGCPGRGSLLSVEDQCAHMRAVEFFAESVQRKNESTFMAQKCDSWSDFKKGKCAGELITMGMNCPGNASGEYYLQTHTESPYSLGLEGLRYNSGDKVTIQSVMLVLVISIVTWR